MVYRDYPNFSLRRYSIITHKTFLYFFYFLLLRPGKFSFLTETRDFYPTRYWEGEPGVIVEPVIICIREGTVGVFCLGVSFRSPNPYELQV